MRLLFEYALTVVLALTLVARLVDAQVDLVTHPQHTTVVEGQNATLICQLARVPPDELNPVIWKKGKSVISFNVLKNGEKFYLVGDFSMGFYNLRIMNVDVSDDDQYQCQVSNHLINSKKANLTVLVPPKGPFVDGKKGKGVVKVDVVLGKEVEISCEASDAKPAATVLWYKDGQKLDNVETVISLPINKLRSTTAILRFTPKASDIGSNYNCIISNEAIPSTQQLRSQLVRLQVVERPVASIAVPAVLKEGDTITVQCNVEPASSDISEYRWYIDDVLVLNRKNKLNLGAANKTWHNAKIGCKAKNKAGFSNTASTTLNVMYAPVYMGKNEKTEADIGDNVTLQCTWDANPVPRVRWTREGDDVALAQSDTLTLENVQQTDSGSYECQASVANVGSSAAVLDLVVNGPPILISPSAQYTNLDDPAIIVCALGSSPGIEQVTWTWTKDGLPYTLSKNEEERVAIDVTNDVKYKGIFESGSKVAKLQIYRVSREDLLAYSCKISNSFGSKKATVTLKEGPSTQSQVSSNDHLIIVASVVGGVVFLAVVVVVAIYCSKTRRESTKKDTKEDAPTQPPATNQNNYEGLPPSRDNAYHVTTSSTFHVATPPSTVFGSDDTNPTTMASGLDDGYSTGENNSWNRKSATPVKNAPESVSYFSGSEKVDLSKPLLGHNIYAGGDQPNLLPHLSFAPPLSYDPTAFVAPSSMRDPRCVSVTPGEYPVPRNLSENQFEPSTTERHYRQYAPMRQMKAPSFETSDYISRKHGATLSAKMRDNRQCNLPDCASQASVELPLGASAVEQPYNIAGRSSVLSGASQNSDHSRPIISKMATHV